LIRKIFGVSSTTPALRATPPNLGGDKLPIAKRLFVQSLQDGKYSPLQSDFLLANGLNRI
jgi:hypothetical protein